ASLKMADFTFAVITESSTYSPVPSFVAVDPHPQAAATTMVRTTIPNPLSALMARISLSSCRSACASLGPIAPLEVVHSKRGAKLISQRIREVGERSAAPWVGQDRDAAAGMPH